jgi:hypothetical protein
LDVHYWLDEEDADLQRAAALGMLGDTGLVWAIERGVQHSTVLLGTLSNNTTGSWWVPYEIGYSRSAEKPVSFLMVTNNNEALQLPEYARIASTYWSVDEVVRWAASLSNHHLHTDLAFIPQQLFEVLAKYVPYDPPEPNIIELCKQSCATIELLTKEETQSLLTLSTTNFDWLPTNGGPIRDIAYDLLAPLAYYQWISDDEKSQQTILGKAYYLPSKHYEVASLAPKLSYNPECEGWKYQRYQTPDRSWMQGLRIDQLEERLGMFLTTKNRNGKIRLATKQEFKAEFDRILISGDSQSKRSLGVLINPLFGFMPASRPVYRRILAMQYQLYKKLLGDNDNSSPFDPETNNIATAYIRTI